MSVSGFGAVTAGYLRVMLDPVTSASDRSTMLEVLDSYRDAGYVADFSAEEDAEVRCGHCSSASSASQYSIRSLRRLEGASDPDDMVSVIATSCPLCGAEGTLVLGYGPAASGIDADVMQRLVDRRDEDDTLPRDAPPDEDPDGITT